MTKAEELRLICLELALDTPYAADPLAKAREYYVFIKEIDGGNVLKAPSSLTRVK